MDLTDAITTITRIASERNQAVAERDKANDRIETLQKNLISERAFWTARLVESQSRLGRWEAVAPELRSFILNHAPSSYLLAKLPSPQPPVTPTGKLQPIGEGLSLIAIERYQQITKGYDAKHDDQHADGMIVEVVEQLIHRVVEPRSQPQRIGDVRWDEDQWHMHILEKWGKDPKQLLVIAGTLIVAEIERLLRVKPIAPAQTDNPKVGVVRVFEGSEQNDNTHLYWAFHGNGTGFGLNTADNSDTWEEVWFDVGFILRQDDDREILGPELEEFLKAHPLPEPAREQGRQDEPCPHCKGENFGGYHCNKDGSVDFYCTDCGYTEKWKGKTRISVVIPKPEASNASGESERIVHLAVKDRDGYSNLCGASMSEYSHQHLSEVTCPACLAKMGEGKVVHMFTGGKGEQCLCGCWLRDVEFTTAREDVTCQKCAEKLVRDCPVVGDKWHVGTLGEVRVWNGKNVVDTNDMTTSGCESTDEYFKINQIAHVTGGVRCFNICPAPAPVEKKPEPREDYGVNIAEPVNPPKKRTK